MHNFFPKPVLSSYRCARWYIFTYVIWVKTHKSIMCYVLISLLVDMETLSRSESSKARQPWPKPRTDTVFWEPHGHRRSTQFTLRLLPVPNCLNVEPQKPSDLLIRTKCVLNAQKDLLTNGWKRRFLGWEEPFSWLTWLLGAEGFRSCLWFSLHKQVTPHSLGADLYTSSLWIEDLETLIWNDFCCFVEWGCAEPPMWLAFLGHCSLCSSKEQLGSDHTQDLAGPTQPQAQRSFTNLHWSGRWSPLRWLSKSR